MEIPSEAGVMTLPNVTLFPQALLPLYIFETRYRRMLSDALHSHRMLIVAMQKPGNIRETPSRVAGLGLIRVAVQNPDETTHLILQGITRVELADVVRYRPYRIHEIQPLLAPHVENVTIDALLAKVRSLVVQRVQLGFHFSKAKKREKPPSLLSIKDVVHYLDELKDPEQVADLVSYTMLPNATERQTMLETVEVESRLKHLIHFLMAEIKEERKNHDHE
jgi:Lon protease-like protein